MHAMSQLSHIVPFGLLTPPSHALLLWGGLGILTVALLLLMRTPWGQAQPLSKCVALSVLAHGLFVGYAYGTRLFCDIPLAPEEEVLRLDFITNRMEDSSPDLPATEAQWGMPLAERVPVPDEFHLERRDAAQPDEDPDRETSEPNELVERIVPDPSELAEDWVDDLVSSLADASTAEQADVLDEHEQESDGVEQEPEAREEVARVPDEPLPDVPMPETPATPVMAEAAPLEVPEPIAAAAPDAPKPEIATARRRPVEDEDEEIRRESSEQIDTESLLAEQMQEGDAIQQLADALESLQVEEARAGEDQLAAADNRRAESRASENEGERSDLPADREPRDLRERDEQGEEEGQSSYVAAAAARVETEQGRAAMRRVGDGAEFPRLLRARISPDRPLLVDRYGGNAETEGAVQAALAWLAAHQSEDGRWRAKDYGAGKERGVLGHNRHGAGGEGDTGMSGLALLAFLAAGHTHYEGAYRTNVQHGLEFLLRSQRSDGSLAGNAELFAAMYCHGMAFLAISEAYAMTGDERLRGYVERAQRYTLSAQIPQDGGWRYQVGDREGDTSQLGWQLMALRSAELAGIPLPERSRRGMERFLESVAAGRSGGLASYRSGSRPSRTMTAEALACWIFLESPPSLEARREAAEFLREELPGWEMPNLYYWYYGSLALFQLQDETWEAWNEAMQEQLLRRQRRTGELAGSWDPETVWGGYGGRVYSTAMGALCLEVYYRYLPLYGRTSLAELPRPNSPRPPLRDSP